MRALINSQIFIFFFFWQSCDFMDELESASRQKFLTKRVNNLIANKDPNYTGSYTYNLGRSTGAMLETPSLYLSVNGLKRFSYCSTDYFFISRAVFDILTWSWSASYSHPLNTFPWLADISWIFHYYVWAFFIVSHIKITRPLFSGSRAVQV